MQGLDSAPPFLYTRCYRKKIHIYSEITYDAQTNVFFLWIKKKGTLQCFKMKPLLNSIENSSLSFDHRECAKTKQNTTELKKTTTIKQWLNLIKRKQVEFKKTKNSVKRKTECTIAQQCLLSYWI